MFAWSEPRLLFVNSQYAVLRVIYGVLELMIVEDREDKDGDLQDGNLFWTEAVILYLLLLHEGLKPHKILQAHTMILPQPRVLNTQLL